MMLSITDTAGLINGTSKHKAQSASTKELPGPTVLAQGLNAPLGDLDDLTIGNDKNVIALPDVNSP